LNAKNLEQEELFHQAEAALAEAKSEGDPTAEKAAYVKLLKALAGEEDSGRKLKWLEEAYQRAAEMDEPRWEASLRQEFIALCLATGHFEKAVEPLQLAIEDAATRRAASQQLTLITELANVNYELERYNRAIDGYKSAMSLAEELEDQLAIVRLLQRLGAAFADKGEPAVSIEYGGLALNRAEQIGDMKLIGEQRVMLALTLADMDHKDEAKQLIGRAAQEFKMAGEQSLAQEAARILSQLED
jgi:tetratricopeptide (TPR) repeat protein